jgi:hypothetical protein
VKVTCTVQLAAAAKVAPQVVALQMVEPQEKLPTAAPVIPNPMFCAATPPLLVIVSVCGALATFKVWLEKLRLAGFALSVAGCSPMAESATCCVPSAS